MTLLLTEGRASRVIRFRICGSCVMMRLREEISIEASTADR
jgi:hypothetical protein